MKDSTRKTSLMTVGAGCFFAWMHSVSFASPISLVGTGAHEGLWFLLNGLSVLVTALYFLVGSRLDGYARGVALPVASCLAMQAAAVVGLFGIWQPPLPLVVLVISLAPLGFWTLWGNAFKVVDPSQGQITASFCGMLLSFPVYLLLTYLPPEAAACLTLLLPIASNASMSRLCRLPQDEPGSEAPSIKGRRPFTLVLVLYVVAFSIPINFLRHKTETAGYVSASDYAIIFMAALLLLSLAALAEGALLRKHRLSVAPVLAVVLVTGSLLTFVVGGPTIPVMALTLVGYFLFVVIMHLKIGQLIYSSDVSPSRTFGLFMGANSLGLLMGTALSVVSRNPLAGEWMGLICIVLAYVIFGVSVFAYPRKMVLDALVKSGLSEQAPEPETNRYVSSMVESIRERSSAAAAEFGLSAREEEILSYLLRGWSLQLIAEEECISRNTVKTHVTHIYQKLNVHTREELSLVIEGLDNGQR